MYRKVALTSVTLNIVFAFGFLVVFMPKFLDLFRHANVEMPWWMMWLVNVSHFVTNPQTIVPTLAVALIGFFGVKAFRKRANIGA